MSWVGKTFRSTVGWEHLETVVDLGGRMAGSESERRAAELTREAFADAGARNAHIEEFEIEGWTRSSSSIRMPESREVDCFALPRSPPGTVEGKLVDVGHGAPEDFDDGLDGAVVMIASSQPPGHERTIHRREKYEMTVESGAAAFVFRNHVEGCLPRSGSISGSDGGTGEIPAIAVSKETGLRLARRFEGESITVDVEADVHDATSRNVRAELGPESAERILVSCHIDGHDISESAHDNAVGVATVVEVANALAEREDDLETRVEVVGFGAEEFGLIGSSHYVDRENIDDIKVVVQNDGVSRARNMRLYTNGFDRLGEVGETIAERFHQPVSTSQSLELSSDHWRFVERGVPAYLVTSEEDDEGAFGSSSGIVLTPADTIDKLDPRDLRTHAILEAELAVELADPGVRLSHVPVSEIERRAEREGESFKADLYRRTAVSR